MHLIKIMDFGVVRCHKMPSLQLLKAGFDGTPVGDGLVEQFEKGPVVLRVFQVAHLVGDNVVDADRRGFYQLGI